MPDMLDPRLVHMSSLELPYEACMMLKRDFDSEVKTDENSLAEAEFNEKIEPPGEVENEPIFEAEADDEPIGKPPVNSDDDDDDDDADDKPIREPPVNSDVKTDEQEV